jgi:AmiR/NasT family two-component response regulator
LVYPPGSADTGLTAKDTAKMGIEILRDLRGLRIEVFHPPDADGISLVQHLRRIGCITTTTWPLPKKLAFESDLIVLAIEHDHRVPLRALFQERRDELPTVIGIVGYENPSILQLILEVGAQAVVERPIRPFGLLTQLAIARSLWLKQQEAGQRIRKLERKLAGARSVLRARLILMANQDLDEEESYQSLRRQAMSHRLGMEEMAAAIIAADDLKPRRSKS